MKRIHICALAVGFLLIAPAADAFADKEPDAVVAASSRGLGDIFKNYSIRLGISSAGPLLFKDVPDGRLEETTVYQLGTRLGVMFGSELKDIHRLGFAVGYDFVAKSESRSLKFITPALLYEIGQPFALEAGLGYTIASGTEGFKDEYGGLYTGLALRYSFQRKTRWTTISVSPALVTRATVVTGDMQFSSVFIGGQLELSYATNK